MAEKTHRFDQLISALSGAVVDAQYMMTQAQLGDLQKFFHERDPDEVEIEIRNTEKQAISAEELIKKIKDEMAAAERKDKKDEVETLKAKLEATKAEVEALKAMAETRRAEAQFKHYSPNTVFFSFQSTRPSAKPGEMDTVPVPLITLVKPVHHSIEEMILNAHVEIGEIKEIKRKDGERKRGFKGEDEWITSESKHIIYVSTISEKERGTIGTAEVTLKIKAEEPQEGLARLIDNLYKIL